MTARAGGPHQADLATFNENTANEFAQLQTVLQKTIDDLVDATRRSVPWEGTNDAGGLGSPLCGSTAGTLLLSLYSPGAARPGQPIGSGPRGPSTFGHAGGLGSGLEWYAYGGARGGVGGPKGVLR